MKVLLTGVFLMFAMVGKAQVSVNFGLGAGYTKVQPFKRNLKPISGVFNWGLQYEYKTLVVKGDLMGLIVRNGFENKKMITGVSLGKVFFNSLTPSIGYYYSKVSSEYRELNSKDIGYSLEYYYKLGDPGGIYLSSMYIDKYIIVTLGFRGTF